MWVVVDKNAEILRDGNINIEKGKSLDQTLKKYMTKNFKQVFPASKNEYLQRVYQIEFDGNTGELFDELTTKFQSKFQKVSKRPKGRDMAAYDPSDYMWYLTTQDTTGWLWHLHKIRANLAWDITHGDPDTKIASIDTWFDINHPDLEQKINPHYDPYDLTNFSTDCHKNNHGTTVASFIAAQTNGGGQLASAGFDCTIIPYQANTYEGVSGYLARAHHASLVMGADVLTSSAGGWYCDVLAYMDTTVERIAVQEILDNGTIIVMPAGNGNSPNFDHCGDDINGYRPFYPINPIYDERIIVVTSTDVNDNHTYGSAIHSYFPEVDICAPGYNVMGATCTQSLDVPTNTCFTNTWPYYGQSSGTSFAAPIVAGVCGLMKSINPCLTPSEAQSIIKSTADPVADEYLYPGMLGAGRINAYKAVKKTGTREYINTTLTGTQSLSAGFGFNLINVVIGNNSNVTLTARKEAVISGTFEVPSGSAFEIAISSTAQNNCQ